MRLWFARDIWRYRNVFWLIDWLTARNSQAPNGNEPRCSHLISVTPLSVFWAYSLHQSVHLSVVTWMPSKTVVFATGQTWKLQDLVDLKNCLRSLFVSLQLLPNQSSVYLATRVCLWGHIGLGWELGGQSAVWTCDAEVQQEPSIDCCVLETEQ